MKSAKYWIDSINVRKGEKVKLMDYYAVYDDISGERVSEKYKTKEEAKKNLIDEEWYHIRHIQ